MFVSKLLFLWHLYLNCYCYWQTRGSGKMKNKLFIDFFTQKSILYINRILNVLGSNSLSVGILSLKISHIFPVFKTPGMENRKLGIYGIYFACIWKICGIWEIFSPGKFFPYIFGKYLGNIWNIFLNNLGNIWNLRNIPPNSRHLDRKGKGIRDMGFLHVCYFEYCILYSRQQS